MNLEVLGPDVNESQSDFSVNTKGHIRFGMSALKGVGEGPVEAILKAREEGGPFKTVFDMMRRLDLRSVNKRCMESLVLGGALDLFEDTPRSIFYAPSEKYDTFLEHMLKYGNAYQNQRAQSANSLFGDSEDAMIPEPKLPAAPHWSLIEKLTREKEVTGIYISGHPLDDYRIEVQNFVTCSLDKIDNFKGQNVNVAGIITSAQHRVNKKGNGWGLFILQDYNNSIEFPLFTEDYQKFKHLLEVGAVLYIKGNMQKRWNSEEFQLKLKEVRQLDSIGTEMTESITIKLPLERINKELVDDIDNLCATHKGKHKLKMVFIDKANKVSLDLLAPDTLVNADSDFIGELDRIGLRYKVN